MKLLMHGTTTNCVTKFVDLHSIPDKPCLKCKHSLDSYCKVYSKWGHSVGKKECNKVRELI